MKFKKGFLANFLVNKGISFAKCGVSQQTYEYMRDGKRISNAAVSKLEKACDVLRDIDFPIEYYSANPDKKTDVNANYINFDFIDLENWAKTHFQKPEEKLDKAKRMHKLDIHSYKKIKKMKFENIKWASEVSEQDLCEQNILKSPFLSKEYSHKKETRKKSGDINDWGNIKDIDAELIEKPITLKILLKKFDENFNKEEQKKYNYTNGSNSLSEAVARNEVTKKNGDQAEIILDYLSHNGYEFQYFILRHLSEGNHKIERRSRDEVRTEYTNNPDGLKGRGFFSFDIYDKNDIKFLEMDYKGTDFEGMEDDASSCSSAESLIQRYIKNCENSEYVSFKYSKFHLYIALVKSKTVNYALYDEKDLRDKNYDDNNKFHSLKKIWAKNYIYEKGKRKSSVTFLDGKYIPNAIPIISQKDYDNFFMDLFEDNPYSNLTFADLEILKSSIGVFEIHKDIFLILKKIFENKENFKNYSWILDVQWRNDQYDDLLDIMSENITFPYMNINPDKYNPRYNFEEYETDKIKCLPNYTAYYDSYLSYLATYHKYYYDKVPDSEFSDFADLFVKDIHAYQSYFGKIEDSKDLELDDDLDLDFLDIPSESKDIIG